MKAAPKIIVGITGASGSIYARNLLQRLDLLSAHFGEVAVIFSQNGKKVWDYELGDDAAVPPGFRIFQPDDLFAPPASGSALYTHMVVCPCSMATLARMAQGIATDLITRAGDVMLKERRTLIVVPREMPYSLVHLRNMEALASAGAVICPASPAFYSRPADIDELVNTTVEKICSLIGFTEGHYAWGGDKQGL